MHDIKKIIICFISIFVTWHCFGQQQLPSYIISKDTFLLAQNASGKVHVKDVTVTGTKKTKVYIVFREIQFKKGDSISLSELYTELEQARFQVYNTTLFNDVNIELTALDADNLQINVQLTERWYLYPVPQFQLIDRNFNDWYKTHNASLNRVNYGLKLVHYNLSGRRDQLRLYLINGYTRNISFSYSNPYSSASLNEGFTIGAGYSQNREIPYMTDSSNKTLFYKKPDFVRNAINVNAGFSIRKGIFRKQVFSLGYTHIKIDDSVLNVKYNPAYFNDRRSSQDVVDIRYVNQYVNVNNVSYPLKGRTSFIALHKRGLSLSGGINMFSVEAGYNKYFDMTNDWYSSFQLNGKLVLPFKQAFINQRNLGYGENYLRGLEYYVIDGVATAILKSTVKKKIIAFDVPFRFFPKLLTKIPFTIFAKSYADIGYAYNKTNSYTYLNNRFLYSGGFGIDILTLYDINLRFEYSFNQLKENGLFLHNQSGF
jgi:Surface antigen variable number repeat